MFLSLKDSQIHRQTHSHSTKKLVFFSFHVFFFFLLLPPLALLFLRHLQTDFVHKGFKKTNAISNSKFGAAALTRELKRKLHVYVQAIVN